MPDLAKPVISFAILALLFVAPIFFIHDYSSDVASNISANAIARLGEVNARAGNNFYQTVRATMMEMNGMTKYLAQQNCSASKENVLAVAPLFYAHGSEGSALLMLTARVLTAAAPRLIIATIRFFCAPGRG